jgi:ATP adenylyltransferase
MQTLWAPWRENYITKITTSPKGCVFCRILADHKDKQHLIFIRAPHAFAVLNLYPYSNGHCLIVPNRHVADISQLPAGEYAGLMGLLLETKALLNKAMAPQGFNIGINLGRMAGAGMPKHVHVHVVPRWQGDHNFMPVTAGTKVISQSLAVLYKKLAYAHQKRH